VKLLLDTHALLWFLSGSGRLSATARIAIEDMANERFFSVAGAWEIAIKASLGKLDLTVPFEKLVPGELRSNDIELLPITPAHLVAVMALPFHHRDPFDRMYVAQAAAEGATVVSADPALDAYGIPRLW
jgi:PIN domain nuclease of toxin-antitoxin system